MLDGYDGSSSQRQKAQSSLKTTQQNKDRTYE